MAFKMYPGGVFVSTEDPLIIEKLDEIYDEKKSQWNQVKFKNGQKVRITASVDKIIFLLTVDTPTYSYIEAKAIAKLLHNQVVEVIDVTKLLAPSSLEWKLYLTVETEDGMLYAMPEDYLSEL